MRSKLLGIALASLVGLFGTSQVSKAASILFSGVGNNGGVALSASAFFEVDNSTSGGPYLKVTLTNTAASSISDPANLLTVLDFSTKSVVGLTNSNVSHPSFAVVPAGSTVAAGSVSTFASGPFSGKSNAGDYWGLQNVSGGINWAIGSTGTGGMGLGTAKSFNNGSMTGDGSPTGGIEPAAGGTGSPMTHGPFFTYQLQFYVYGIGSTFDPSTQISNVQFLYGTSSSEPHFTPNLTSVPPVVPLPAAAWSGLALLGGLGVTRKIRKHLQK